MPSTNRVQYLKETFTQTKLRNMARVLNLTVSGNKTSLASRISCAENGMRITIRETSGKVEIKANPATRRQVREANKRTPNLSHAAKLALYRSKIERKVARLAL